MALSSVVRPDRSNQLTEKIRQALQAEFSRVFINIQSIITNRDVTDIDFSRNFRLTPEQADLVSKIDPKTRNFIFPISQGFISKVKSELKGTSSGVYGHQALVDSLFDRELEKFLKSIKGVRIVRGRDGFDIVYSAHDFISRIRDILYTNFHNLMKSEVLPYLLELVRITKEYEAQYYSDPNGEDFSKTPLLESLTIPSSERLSVYAGKGRDYFIWTLAHPISHALKDDASIDQQDGINFRDLIGMFLESIEDVDDSSSHWTNIKLSDGSNFKDLIFPRGSIEKWLKERLDLFVLQNGLPIQVQGIFPTATGQMPQYIQFEVLTMGQYRLRKAGQPFRVAITRILEPIQQIPTIRQRISEAVQKVSAKPIDTDNQK